MVVFPYLEEPEVPRTPVSSAHSEEPEIPHAILTSGIEATETLLGIVEQNISKYRKYQWMLWSLRSELMQERRVPGTV